MKKKYFHWIHVGRTREPEKSIVLQNVLWKKCQLLLLWKKNQAKTHPKTKLENREKWPPEIPWKLILSNSSWIRDCSADAANAFCLPMHSRDRKLPKTASGMKSILLSSSVVVIAWITFKSSAFTTEIVFLLLKHQVLFILIICIYFTNESQTVTIWCRLWI